MSLGTTLASINRSLSEARATAGDAPVRISVWAHDIEFLLNELQSRTANITALQKKLNVCTNVSKQKDDMVARRDRSIAKAHSYIEQLKADIRAAKQAAAKGEVS